MNYSDPVISDALKSIYFKYQDSILLENGVLYASDYNSDSIHLIKQHIAQNNDDYPELLGKLIQVEKTDSYTINSYIESFSKKGMSFQLDDKDVSTIGKDAKAMLQLACNKDVSDIHIELYSNETKIYVRIDGRLVELNRPIPEYQYGLTLITYLFNELAKDKDEDFYPTNANNGRIELELETPSENGKSINRETRWRLSFIPAQGKGGQATLRWSNKDTSIPAMNKLGWEKGHVESARNFMSSASGLCILAGQTNSGKSTAIASMLNELKGTGRAINTIEDPVEFDIGVIQTSVKDDDELQDYIKLLLRHDPDIEMHGEMRGYGGAMAACRKAETGQLLFTTIHTSSAIGVAHTMNEQMKVPISLIGADLMKIWIYQTLVRVLCPHCSLTLSEAEKNWSDREKEQFQQWRNYGVSLDKVRFKNPCGCKKCIQGEKGRTAILEMIVLDDEDRQYILKKDYLGWSKALKQKGYKTVIDHANLKISRGEVDLFTAGGRVNNLFSKSTKETYNSFFDED